MNAILLALVVGLILGTLHCLRSENGKKNIKDAFGEQKEGEKETLVNTVQTAVKSLLPDFQYSDSEIAKIITGVFKLIVIPVRAVGSALVHLIAKCIQWALKAEKRNKKLDNNEDDGEHHWSLLVAVFSLFCLIFLTLANYKILCLGLEWVLPFSDERPFAYIGRTALYIIPVMAVIFIAAELLLSLMGKKYRNKSSNSSSNSKDYWTQVLTYLFYTGLITFAGVEAVLAVIRTIQLTTEAGSSPLFGNLPLWAVGIISFMVPLIAAFAFEYATQYFIQLGSTVLGLLAALVWLPIFLAELTLLWIHALLILILEVMAIPAKVVCSLKPIQNLLGNLENKKEIGFRPDSQITAEDFLQKLQDLIDEKGGGAIMHSEPKKLAYDQGGERPWFSPEKED